MAKDYYWLGPGVFSPKKGKEIEVGEKMPEGTDADMLKRLAGSGKVSSAAPVPAAAGELEKLTAQLEDVAGQLTKANAALEAAVAERDELTAQLAQAESTVASLTDQLTKGTAAGPAGKK